MTCSPSRRFPSSLSAERLLSGSKAIVAGYIMTGSPQLFRTDQREVIAAIGGVLVARDFTDRGVAEIVTDLTAQLAQSGVAPGNNPRSA